jgi:hypothetical protein
MANMTKLKAIETGLWAAYQKRAVALAMLKEAQQEGLTLTSQLGAELNWDLGETAGFLDKIDPKQELVGWSK